METIKHAAVKSKDGWIFIGKCHADCFHKMHHINVKSCQKADSQGFVTSEGRYVGRHEGYNIAQAASQIDFFIAKEGSDDDTIFNLEDVKRAQILFSEDLWCHRYNGKHNYCEIEGYKRRDECK